MKRFIDLIAHYKIHFIGWSIFIAFEILVIGFGTGKFGNAGSYAVHYLVNIILFYVCGHLLYPAIFKTKFSWLWKLPLGGGFVFLMFLIVNYIIDVNLVRHTQWLNLIELNMTSEYIFKVLWRAHVFMGNACFYFLFLRYRKEIKKRQLAEKEKFDAAILKRKLQVELERAKTSYLKAQINPHLLFNTLSFIYTDILTKSPKAAEAVMSLSEIMRYGVNCEFTAEKVPLKDEIEQVKNLIKLHQSRFDDELYITFSYDEAINDLLFIPLVLITITENVFKHGFLLDPLHPAVISIKVDDSKLIIRSSNYCSLTKNKNGFNKGLDNILERLQISYGEKAKMTFRDENDYFELVIFVALDK